MNLFFIKAMLMSFLPFYRVDFPVETFPKELTYIEYNHGREVGKRILSEEETIYIALKELFTNNEHGWRYDLNTYSPGRLFISSKMKINCIDGAVIVNYESERSDWVQISKEDVTGSCPAVYLDGTKK